MTNQEKEQLKTLLLKEKATLENELSKFADKNPDIEGDYKTRFPKIADASDTVDERAQDVTEYERDRAVEQNLELRLKEINETLEKLESGDYGICSNCKSPIEPARIKAMPIVTACFNCAKNSTLI